LPKGVSVSVSGKTVQVKGPKATLSEQLPQGVELDIEENEVIVRRRSEQRKHRAFHGLARALVQNMVIGVSEGFERELEIHGVGYRADTKDGKTLSFNLGHSHPVEMALPEGVKAEVTNRGVRIKLFGVSKEVLGQVIADIRALRPPEPYKGKGIRFVGERIRRKVGKAGATA
jgi:large subunit ribosomal protein L6